MIGVEVVGLDAESLGFDVVDYDTGLGWMLGCFVLLLLA